MTNYAAKDVDDYIALHEAARGAPTKRKPTAKEPAARKPAAKKTTSGKPKKR